MRTNKKLMRITRRNKRNALKKHKSYKRKFLKSKRSTKRQMKKMMRGGGTGNVLLIIDPQRDFVETTENPKASLGVPGAGYDMTKIAKFVEDNIDKLDEIHVSLDTHTVNHIGHVNFWQKGMAESFDTFLVKPEDPNIYIKTGEDGEPRIITTTNPDLQEFAYKYIETMQNNKIKYPSKPTPCIWPNHCIIDLEHNIASENWHVHETLRKVLNEHSNKVFYHEKGTNDLVEMYSIFSAEIPYEDLIKTVTNSEAIKALYPNYNQNMVITPVQYESSNGNGNTPLNPTRNYKTTFNETLFKRLMSDNKKVFVCGEAKTHCVKTSLEDMVKQCNNYSYNPRNIFLLDDMTSPIPVPPIVDAMNASFDNLKNIGMQIMPSSEFKNKIIETVGPKPTNIPKYIEKYIPPESQWSKSDIQKAYDNYLSQPKNPREKYVPKQPNRFGPNNGWTPK